MSKEIIELLEKALATENILKAKWEKSIEEGSKVSSGFDYANQVRSTEKGLIRQALTLLKQQPKTLEFAINCGAMGKGDDSCCGCIYWSFDGRLLCNECGTEYHLVEQQPPAGEQLIIVRPRQIGKMTEWVKQLRPEVKIEESYCQKQRDDLLKVLENALVSLAVISMPREDNNVATDAEILKIMGDSFRAAIAKAEKEG